MLGLVGPDTKISSIMPCTVIRPGDMADRILDREKPPQWQGERAYVYRTELSNDIVGYGESPAKRRHRAPSALLYLTLCVARAAGRDLLAPWRRATG